MAHSVCGSQAVRGTEGGDPAADSGPNLLILSSGDQGTEGGNLVSHTVAMGSLGASRQQGEPRVVTLLPGMPLSWEQSFIGEPWSGVPKIPG